ncbi:MAG: formimidoylglutamase [Peptoniphilaceae bacterium]
MLNNYYVEDKSSWNGRIDSYTDYDSFRWHQWVEFIDLNDENLKSFTGKLGFAIIGFQSDYGINLNKGRIGAAYGPKNIRAELAKLPCHFDKEVKIFDAGNISPDDLTLDEAQDVLAEAVDKILSLNLFPIVLGGGHDVTFGHYKGLFKHNFEDKKEIGIINFDAHFDLRPYKENGGSSGTMFRQMYDLNMENDFDYHYLVMGIQKHSNTTSLFKFADAAGVEYVLAKDMIHHDLFSIFEQVDDFMRKVDSAYVTICSDVFSSSFAPGVSAPQPLGLDPEIVILILKHILTYDKVISFDIAEVSPRFDKDNTTASLAAVLIFTLVSKLARKTINKKKAI